MDTLFVDMLGFARKAVWIALLLLVAVAIALAATKRRRQRRSERLLGPWPLQVRRQLLGEREQALFSRLVQSLPEHIVLSQVHLLQVVEFWPGGRTHALKSAGVPLIRWRAWNLPDAATIRAAVLEGQTTAETPRE